MFCGLRSDSAGPLVSVVVPAYNVAAYIRETVTSVLAQTLTDLELIVINDGSTDIERLEEALEPYGSAIVYLKQNNGGPGAARNLGIRHARGRYVAFLDGDDSWAPEYLRDQLRMFEENPALDMVYCDAACIGNTALSGKTYMELCPSEGRVTFDSLVSERCQVITSCAVVRRDVFAQCGLFDVELRGTEDFHMWIRMAYSGATIGYQKAVLGRYRIHSGSLSSSTTRMHSELIRALEKIHDDLPLAPEQSHLVNSQIERFRAELELAKGKAYLFGGQMEEARESLRRANIYFHRLKLRTVIMGLWIAPRLTRSMASLWLGHRPGSKRPGR